MSSPERLVDERARLTVEALALEEAGQFTQAAKLYERTEAIDAWLAEEQNARETP